MNEKKKSRLRRAKRARAKISELYAADPERLGGHPQARGGLLALVLVDIDQPADPADD